MNVHLASELARPLAHAGEAEAFGRALAATRWVEPSAVVGDFEDDDFAVFFLQGPMRGAGPQSDCPVGADGIGRVLDKIDQDLP